MAKETKSISIVPSEEQDTIELWQKFGWELVSSQEIFNRDSHLEESGDHINSVTTTTNYVKLVFARDKEMKNYSQIVDLENRFNGVAFPIRKSAKPLFILGAVGSVAGVGLITEKPIIGITLLIAGIAILVLGFVKKSKNTKIYNAEYSAAISKRREILEEVSKYC